MNILLFVLVFCLIGFGLKWQDQSLRPSNSHLAPAGQNRQNEAGVNRKKFDREPA